MTPFDVFLTVAFSVIVGFMAAQWWYGRILTKAHARNEWYDAALKRSLERNASYAEMLRETRERMKR